jgi:16S rRNA (guanine527-N7)-methyltransferase
MEPLVPQRIEELAPRFLDLLDRWNATHALTALPPEARWEELIQDACALLPHLAPLPPGSRVLDLGTGMGIPAAVLAMARPDLQIHALDKSRKKIAFVRQAVMELGLGNLFPVVGRAEEVPPLHADLGTAKAVGSPALLSGWWDRHGKPMAPLLLLKGEDWRSEPFPVGWSGKTFPYRLPLRGERVILQLKREPGP